MTVEELIKRLRKVKNKQAEVSFMVCKDNCSQLDIEFIAESVNSDLVVLF